jgi:hypothetical protein
VPDLCVGTGHRAAVLNKGWFFGHRDNESQENVLKKEKKIVMSTELKVTKTMAVIIKIRRRKVWILWRMA